MSITYTLSKNPLHPDRLRALVRRESSSMKAFLAYCQRTSTVSSADVAAVLDCMVNWVLERAQAGQEATFGDLGRTRLGMKIPPDTKHGEALDPGDTLLTVNWVVSRRLKKQVAAVGRSPGCKYVRQAHRKVSPNIENVEDRNLKENNVYAVGHLLQIKGDRLKFDPDRQDEGVFFKPARGREVRAVEYTHITRNTVDARVPEGLSGPLDVFVRNRGWSKHETRPRQGQHEKTLSPAG